MIQDQRNFRYSFWKSWAGGKEKLAGVRDLGSYVLDLQEEVTQIFINPWLIKCDGPIENNWYCEEAYLLIF